MKRNILYLIFGLFLLASCQQEELPDVGTGYLAIADLSVEAPQVNVVSSRAEAAEEPLTIEIVKGESIQTFTESNLPSKIELEVGDYVLKAYNSQYGKEDETGLGAPVYYKEESFTIETNKTTSVEVSVPMINFGVKLDLPDNFNTLFPTSTFTVSGNERQVELKDGETAYFSYKKGVTFDYVLSATNKDQEQRTMEGSYGTEGESVASGTIYTVTYELGTRSFSITR